MRLSTRSRYGMRILLQIALDNREGKLSRGKNISKKQDISEPYVEQIMIPLKSAGVVRTVRGCNGGYHLNREPKDISVLEIIELFEGKLLLVDCSGTGTKESCTRIKFCPTRTVWEKLSAVLSQAASGITLEDIIRDHNESGEEYTI